MNTADGLEIAVGGRYWTPTDDENNVLIVTAVKLHPPKKDDLFEDLHTVEVVGENDKKWHEFPSEMFSTKETCLADVISRNERKRESMYDSLEKLELSLHNLKTGGI